MNPQKVPETEIRRAGKGRQREPDATGWNFEDVKIRRNVGIREASTNHEETRKCINPEYEVEPPSRDRQPATAALSPQIKNVASAHPT